MSNHFSKIILTLFILAIASYAVVSITPDNPNIRYNGVIESTITSTQAELLRVTSDYINAPWSYRKGDWTPDNAGTQPGITIEVRTTSPTVTFNFTLNNTYEDRWSRMALYRNGNLEKTVQVAAGSPISSISATVSGGDTATWTCVLPGFKAHYFTGVTIDDGHVLAAFPTDTRPIYVAIGNSITHGQGQTATAGYLSYPFQVADSLGYHLYNLGIGGSKINEAILDNLTGITPDVITVLWGYNDVVYSTDPMDSCYNDYDTLLTNILTRYPSAKVYAILQTYTNTIKGQNDTTKTIAQLRADQTEIITNLQATYSNLYMLDGASFTDASHLSDDVHLNDAGATAVANAIIAEITGGVIEPPRENIYVSTTGSNSNTGSESNPYLTIGYAMGQAQPGDTVFVMPGTYQNTGYGDGTTDNTNIAYINEVHGSEGNEIVLMSQIEGQAKLQFDGAGGLIFNNVSYLVIDGFEIEGPGASIDTADAIAHRLDNPVEKLYSGRGIAFWGTSNHHIAIKNNNVHHCANSGIRVNKGDYITIENNTVWRNCWWSPNAESGVVIAEATNVDDEDSIKIIFRNNVVYDNGNYVVYVNHTYGLGDEYGQPGYDQIVDGQGLYVTRSNDTYLFGRILIENNLSVNNGINGICFHHTNRGIIRHNTVYKNGQYPDRPISGITVNGADDVLVYNNIVVAQNDKALTNYENSTNVQLAGNIIYDGTSDYDSGSTVADPLLQNPTIDPLTWDFQLQAAGSPAVDNGDERWTVPSTDIAGNLRPVGNGYDIGAYELLDPTPVVGPKKSYTTQSWTLRQIGTQFHISSVKPVTVSVFTANGKQINLITNVTSTNFGHSYSKGMYFVKVQGVDGVKTLKLRK